MEKMKLLTVFLLCLGIAAIAWSTEVISIDLNGGVYDPYTGLALEMNAEDVVWRAYYTGTGKPMGSARSADLPDYDEPNIPSTYAAGVWIDDPCVYYHNYKTGTGLMDDGFEKKAGAAEDPCLFIFAVPTAIPGSDPNNRDGRAFGGTFDIYVYSANETNFVAWTTDNDYGPNECNTTGGYTGTFVKGQNYQVFEEVLIDDENSLSLAYDGTINGLQLVSKKQIVTIASYTNYSIETEDYDVCYEKNGRNATRLGPDIGDYNQNYPVVVPKPADETAVGYLEGGESMTYDIEVVGEDGDGVYKIYAFVLPKHGDASVSLYLNMGGEDIELGEVTADHAEDVNNFTLTDNYVEVRLFEGKHTLKWMPTSGYIYFDIGRLDLEYFPENEYKDPNFDTCAQVRQYGYAYDNDFDEDCDVDYDDLSYYVGDNWLECYSPDPNDCL